MCVAQNRYSPKTDGHSRYAVFFMRYGWPAGHAGFISVDRRLIMILNDEVPLPPNTLRIIIGRRSTLRVRSVQLFRGHYSNGASPKPDKDVRIFIGCIKTSLKYTKFL